MEGGYKEVPANESQAVSFVSTKDNVTVQTMQHGTSTNRTFLYMAACIGKLLCQLVDT